MKPALLVATNGWDPEAWATRVRALLPGRNVLATTPDGIFRGDDAALAGVRYALVWKAPQQTIDRLENLSAIFSLGAGVDHVFALTRLPDVPLVRIVDDDLTSRMVEYVVWQALDHLRRGIAYRRQQRAALWFEHEQPASRDVTVGIMGLGIMGRAAVDALLPLGFGVRGWSRSPTTIAGVETFAGAAGLDAFLSGTDILVCVLPLTPETRHILDLRLFRRLRRSGSLGGPVVINAGRGGLQVEADIVTALREGILAGASLDVFEEEPLPAESQLWGFDNATITPHIAAVSNPQVISIQVARQIEAFERGEPLRNRVDRERGY